MDEARFEGTTKLREPNRWFGALVSLLALGPLAFALTSPLHGLPPWILIQMAFGWWPARNRVYRDNWRAKERSAAVRVTSEGVSIDLALAIPRARIADGFVVVRGAQRAVRLLDARGVILTEIDVENDGQASDILSAIGVAASQRRARFDCLLGGWVNPRWNVFTWLATLGFFALFALVFALVRYMSAPTSLLPFIGYSFLPLMLISTIFPAALEVGADGILVRWWRLRRFVSYGDVRMVEPRKGRVRIVLNNGQVVEVPMSGAVQEIAAKQSAVIARVDDAMKLHHSVQASRELAARLGRGDRATSAWLRTVRMVRDGQAGYREGAVREDDLWHVLEDSSAPADARAAAAVLLRDGGAPAKERIRVVAETTASPRLRVALDVAASDAAADAEAFDEALAELEASPAELESRSS